VSMGQRLAAGTTQLALSNAVVRMLSFATMPILTRLLTPEAYGTAAIAGTVISIVAVISLAGIDMSYARAFHSSSPPSGAPLEAFAWRYALGAAVLAGVIAAAAWWLAIAGSYQVPANIALWLALGVVLSVSNTMAQTGARLGNRYRALSGATLVAGLASASFSVAIALWWRADEIALIVSMLIGYLLPTLILGGPPISSLRSASGLDPHQRLEVLKIGLAGVVTAPALWMLSSLDRWYLGYYEGAASVGVYSIGYNVGLMGSVITGALQLIWLPEASREFEEDEEKARLLLGRLGEQCVAILGVVWLFITAAGGDLVRLLADPQYHSAAGIVPLIAGAGYLHGVAQLATTGLLLKKRLHLSIWWWLIAAGACVILNGLLVPSLGRLGAAWTQLATFGLLAFGIILTSQRLLPLQIRTGRLCIGIAGIAGIGLLMSPAWMTTPLTSLAVKLPIGLLTAWIAGRYLAPGAIRILKQRLLSTP